MVRKSAYLVRTGDGDIEGVFLDAALASEMVRRLAPGVVAGVAEHPVLEWVPVPDPEVPKVTIHQTRVRVAPDGPVEPIASWTVEVAADDPRAAGIRHEIVGEGFTDVTGPTAARVRQSVASMVGRVRRMRAQDGEAGG